MDTFSFLLNTTIKYGLGSRNKIIDILFERNWLSIGICIDKNIANLPMFADILDKLKSQLNYLFVQEIDITEPTYDYLESIRDNFLNTKLDAIIGIGGGSALDVAKGIGVLINNKKSAISYRGFDKMTEPVLPLICIPTTAGTGSEITPNASFIDTKEKRKLGINGEEVRPKYAILDPELTLSCPIAPTISAGVDAIVHAHDFYISKGHTTMGRVFSLEGFRRVYNNLPKVLQDPEDINFRAEVLYGAFFAAVGMIHSGGGAAAVLSYPLGVHYGVPHGIAGGIFLPHVVKFNSENGLKDYGDFYKQIEGVSYNQDKQELPKLFSQHLFSTFSQLGVPSDIVQYGFNNDAIQQFIDEVMEMKGGLDGNPLPFGEKEIRNILMDLM